LTSIQKKVSFDTCLELLADKAGELCQEDQVAEVLAQYCGSRQKTHRKQYLAWAANARELSRTWRKQEISVLENPAWNPVDASRAPRWLFCKGAMEWLTLSKGTILYSRFSKNPESLAETVRVIGHAVTAMRQEGTVVVSSYGTIAYNLMSLAAKGAALAIVCPEVLPFMSPGRSCSFLEDYADFFDLENTLFVSEFVSGSHASANDKVLLRDRLVSNLAEEIHVGWIRPGGNMQAMLDIAAKRNSRIIRYPEQAGRATERAVSQISTTDGDKSETTSVGRALPPRSRSAPGGEVSELPPGYIIHYTRSSRGPWPGETQAEYYAAMLSRPLDAIHSAFCALKRILEEKKVRASGKLSRNSAPVVSFTECRPDEITKLRRWRRGLARWSFEPYGVGFPKTALHELGARPVIYGPESAYPDLGDELGYLFHIHGKDDTQWYLEKEWRLQRGLDIIDSLWQKMVVITPSIEEAQEIVETFACDVFVSGGILDARGPGRPGGKTEC
jgi:hypothetical protein